MPHVKFPHPSSPYISSYNFCCLHWEKQNVDPNFQINHSLFLQTTPSLFSTHDSSCTCGINTYQWSSLWLVLLDLYQSIRVLHFWTSSLPQFLPCISWILWYSPPEQDFSLEPNKKPRFTLEVFLDIAKDIEQTECKRLLFLLKIEIKTFYVSYFNGLHCRNVRWNITFKTRTKTVNKSNAKLAI